MIIDGKELATKVQFEIEREVEELKKKLISPALAIIQANEEKASESYAKISLKKDKTLVYTWNIINSVPRFHKKSFCTT